MRSRYQTVKSRVIMLMILFAMLVTVLVSALSFYLMYNFQRRTTVQSTEFNLQLVANMIEQDLRDLTALAKWSGISNAITSYYVSGGNIKANAVRAYNRLNEEFMYNRASAYVRRLIVFDDKREKILQVGNFSNSSEPVTIYNVGRIEELGLDRDSEWETMVYDPFYLINAPINLPLTCPLYHPSDRSQIGTVFLEASAEVITDKLSGYSLPEGSWLYLTLNNRLYKIEKNNFSAIEAKIEILRYNTTDSTSEKTTVATIRDEDGRLRTTVSYPVRDGISLTQVLSDEQMLPRQGPWISLLVGLCILILSLALFITYSMDKNISRPVAALRKKINAIAQGDFSYAPELESDNELGQVGRGINALSRDVVALMESRVADEKNKRDLEYRMLQSQISPHFLYNTLNSIKMMATIQSANGIVEMTTSLSRLLRTISKDIRRVVPLREELELLDDYIVIQKYRYGDSVSVIKEIADESLLDTPIPRFSLQPIVENAIFHGLEPKGGGTIRIVVKQKDDLVMCSVTDDGVGMNRDALEKILCEHSEGADMLGKIGVRNVDERLRHAFGEGCGLMIRSEPGSYTAMTISLPIHRRESIKEEDL